MNENLKAESSRSEIKAIPSDFDIKNHGISQSLK